MSSAEADVERLPAAAQREQQAVGLGSGRYRADRHRTLERRDRGAEGFDERCTGGTPRATERRDDLGVGGDLAAIRRSLVGHDVGVVVDVTVQRGNDVRGLLVRA